MTTDDGRPLARLAPRRQLVGIWLPVLALGLVLAGIALDATGRLIPGVLASAVGAVLAWFGRNTRWRGIAIAALFLGVLLVLASLVVYLVGQGNFGVPA